MIVIVGSGISGATYARLAAEAGHKVHVVEKRGEIGGNVADYVEPHSGIRVSRYGAHLFHTNDAEVWAFVNRFAVWIRYDHKVLALTDSGVYCPVPANGNTLNTICGANVACKKDIQDYMASRVVGKEEDATNSEEMALARVGPELFSVLYEKYTAKQWNCEARDLSPFVLARLPVRHSFDDRYFTDRYQGLPRDGYSAFIKAMLNHPNIAVSKKTDYFCNKMAYDSIASKVIYTGPVDSYFAASGLEPLEYRSLEFSTELKECWGVLQPAAVVNYVSADDPRTRTVEYKHFLNQKSRYTVLVHETSKSEGEPYYPLPTLRNRELFESYKALADAEPKVEFLGRLATYKYINMDQAVRLALDAFKSIDLTSLKAMQVLQA